MRSSRRKASSTAQAPTYRDSLGQVWSLVASYTTKRGKVVAAYYRRLPGEREASDRRQARTARANTRPWSATPATI